MKKIISAFILIVAFFAGGTMLSLAASTPFLVSNTQSYSVSGNNAVITNVKTFNKAAYIAFLNNKIAILTAQINKMTANKTALQAALATVQGN